MWSEVPGQARAHFQTPPPPLSFSTGVLEVVRQGVGNNPGTMLTIYNVNLVSVKRLETAQKYPK